MSYKVNGLAALIVSGVAVMAVGDASAQSVSGVPFWSEPSYAPYNEVLFPFPFTWPHDRRRDAEIVYVPGNEGDAITYRIPVTDTAFALCMRVGEVDDRHYTRVFREGDFACFFDGYQFSAAQKLNAYISYRRPGERIVAHGYRRTRNGYEPIQETIVLRRIPPIGAE